MCVLLKVISSYSLEKQQTKSSKNEACKYNQKILSSSLQKIIEKKSDPYTLSNVPLNIKSKGGRYKEARLSREPFAVDGAFLSDSHTGCRFDSSSKFRNAINGLCWNLKSRLEPGEREGGKGQSIKVYVWQKSEHKILGGMRLLYLTIISFTLMKKVVLASIELVNIQHEQVTSQVQKIKAWFHQTNSKQPVSDRRFAKPDTNVPNKIIFYHRR